jgi:methylenetetrahydrofolate dehydrogenase (NADP+) / methenyltetrahydrofolate cyclohydrolase
MGQLIDGKAVAEKIQKHTRGRVLHLREHGIIPRLAVILVGNDQPSATYVRKKGEAAEAIGIEFSLHALPETTTTEKLLEYLQNIQREKDLSGLIVQLPLPRHINTSLIVNAVDPQIDVDCLTDTDIGRLVMKNSDLLPPTPGAVLAILEDLNISLTGKNVTIIGTGPLVGKPLAIIMMNAGASVTTCNSHTKNIKEKSLSADIIVTGVGKKDLLRGDMVSPGAIVIDTGVAFVDKKMYGDVNVAEILEKAAWVTPTPGGVGPITVAKLLANTAHCAEAKEKK